jgi:hypothetical protein
LCWDPNVIENPIIVYVGAADGKHISFLSELYPQVEFHLYDPRDFHILESEKIKLHNEFFSDNDALEWSARQIADKNIFFISDIRTANYEKMSYQEVEAAVLRDNENQRQWFETINPVSGLLKCRPPYDLGFQNRYYRYLGIKLGSGSFSEVYQGECIISSKEVKTSKKRALKKIVAIKVFNDGSNGENEEKILKKMNHPGIIKLIEFIKADRCIILEYAPYGDLHDYISEKNLSEEEAKPIFKQVYDAVKYIHSSGYIHGDIKPENVLLFSKDPIVVKLTDFGFSRKWESGSRFKSVCGTLGYSSPEILCQKEVIGPEIDMWSLGALLYVIIYRCKPISYSDLVLHKKISVPITPSMFSLIKFVFDNFFLQSFHLSSPSCLVLIKGLLCFDPLTRFSSSDVDNCSWMC